MKKIDVMIGENKYYVDVAETREEKYKGLRGVEKLDKNKGMLFVWDDPENVTMTMDETLIPLDQVFINEDWKVTKVAHRDDTENDDLVGKANTIMVLEVNINSGIKVGDEFDIVDEGTPKMKVLAPDGSTQMELEGGERIFSRKNTIVLIRQAKKAYMSKEDSDYKRLGKSMFKYLNIQNNNKPEYVEAPK